MLVEDRAAPLARSALVRRRMHGCATASPRTVCLCSVCLEGEGAAGCCRSPVLNWRKVALGRPCTQCVARDKWFVRMMHAQVTMVGAGRQSSALCP